MASNPYSNSKVGWHLDRLQAMRSGGVVRPVHVHFIMSDFCNQSCVFCSYRAPTGLSVENFGVEGNINPMRQIPLEKCKEILTDCAEVGVEAIQFTGGGEPTTHPNHGEILKYAHDLGLSTALVTNGVILRDLDAYKNLAWLRISLDAGVKETYEEMRISNSWDKVLEHLTMFASLQPKVVVGVSFVVTEYNWREIRLAAIVAKASGVGSIRFSTFLFKGDEGHLEPEQIREVSFALDGLANLETPTFKIYDMFGERVAGLRHGPPKHSFCGYQQITVYIGGDQKVYRCCTTAYTDHGEIGSLKDQRFIEWFENESQDRYLTFDATTCNYCQFNEKNEFIYDIVRGKPKHVEFV